MFSLTLQCDEGHKDELVAALWEAGTAGITELEQPGGPVTLRAFFDESFDAGDFARYAPCWAKEPDTDWAAESRAAWPSREVGERFFIVPPWNEDPVPEGRVRLVINPGIGFGTGADLTTQLCLEALERELRPADCVLDFGTGSGILALAAHALGAGRIAGCDIDEDALRAARPDLPESIGLFVGAIRSVRSGSIDLLLANLNAETVTGHAAEMARVLRPGGRIIISGVSPRHAERVCKALEASGIPAREVHVDSAWARIVCEAKA